jgi:hypothetical protein
VIGRVDVPHGHGTVGASSRCFTSHLAGALVVMVLFSPGAG